MLWLLLLPLCDGVLQAWTKTLLSLAYSQGSSLQQCWNQTARRLDCSDFRVWIVWLRSNLTAVRTVHTRDCWPQAPGREERRKFLHLEPWERTRALWACVCLLHHPSLPLHHHSTRRAPWPHFPGPGVLMPQAVSSHIYTELATLAVFRNNLFPEVLFFLWTVDFRTLLKVSRVFLSHIHGCKSW